MKWLPIEMAPKDGTRILACRAGEPDEIEITEWCMWRRWVYSPHPTLPDVYVRDEEVTEFWNGNGHRATHWMPLPPPPEKDRT